MVGITLLGIVLLVVGLAGLAAFWVATLSRTSGTSPLAQLATLAWSATYVVAAVLTWRRSHLAAHAFLVAMGLPMLLWWYILPGHPLPLLLPLFAVTFLFAFLGYRYLRRACESAA
jgi:hypothetical protein